MTVEWVALGVIAVVAYTCCAGLTWRFVRPVPNDHVGWCECDECERNWQAPGYAGLWPLYWTYRLLGAVAYALYLPLRATFRLVAGDRACSTASPAARSGGAPARECGSAPQAERRIVRRGELQPPKPWPVKPPPSPEIHIYLTCPKCGESYEAPRCPRCES